MTQFYLSLRTQWDEVTHRSPQTPEQGLPGGPFKIASFRVHKWIQVAAPQRIIESAHCEVHTLALTSENASVPLARIKCFTFWKGIVIVQFQRAVHTGKLAFTGRTPINETATKDKQKNQGLASSTTHQ